MEFSHENLDNEKMKKIKNKLLEAAGSDFRMDLIDTVSPTKFFYIYFLMVSYCNDACFVGFPRTSNC